MKNHYTIPFFIPHKGCGFSCIFCNQNKISGRIRPVTPNEVAKTISRHLKTIPMNNTRREAAFFGGSFTGLPVDLQKSYLRAVQPFIRKDSIHSIRVSTRPDYIDQNILDMLKKYHVQTIELGVQSMSDDVLLASHRGHTAAAVRRASLLIRMNGFTLGHQLMVGLPKSTFAKEFKTARLSVAMGAKELRIYPVLVLRSTKLAAMWRKGAYTPLTENAAVRRCARLMSFFKSKGVKVLRCGLHPSPGLITGRDILDGPFHQAFGQKVETYMYGAILKDHLKRMGTHTGIRSIRFNPHDSASIIGYERMNAKFVERLLARKMIFSPDTKVGRGDIVLTNANGREIILKSTRPLV